VVQELLGESPALAAVRAELKRLLSRPATGRRLPPILIEGETGTGKGLVAALIHARGPRASAAFVDVNCAAIPETLLEAELFGFERGAFTDARQAKPGLLHVAHRGTIFLDEVGLLAEALQVKLLKAIEDREVRRLGATRAEPADAWVLAATSEKLQDAIRARRFREDLYHRLAVITVRLPPLRERGNDILLLARHYLERACREYGLPPKSIAADAAEALLAYGWPGNVRELANLMERVALLSDDDRVVAASLRLPRELRPPAAARGVERVDDQIATLERTRIEDALRAEGGNISRAAARLGLPRNTFRYRMVRHGLAESGEGTHTATSAAAPVHASTVSAAAAPVRWQRTRITFLQVRLDGAAPHDRHPVLAQIAEKITGFGGRLIELDDTFVRGAFGLDSREDAPLQAAHAAFAAQRTVGSLASTELPLSSRIVMHTAEVLVGRLDGRAELHSDWREVQPVLDELVTAAAADVILASPAARPFLERRFDLEPAGGPSRVIGFSEGARATSPFVSRERELGMLEHLLEQVEHGRSQTVLLAGDAGIGKTRLLDEFRRRTRGRAAWLQGSAVSFGNALPFHPLIDLLKRAFAVRPDDSDETIAARVHAALAPLGESVERSAPFLRTLLAAAGTDPALAQLDPKLRRAGMFEAIAQFLTASSRSRPVVVVLEDLQWMDQATGEFLTEMVERLMSGRILLCVTHRTGDALPSGPLSFGTQIALANVSPADSAAIASALLGVERLSPGLQRLLDEKTDGNPFFIEEVLRSLQEDDLIVRDGNEAGLRPGVGGIEVPDRLQDVLLGRIERLDAGAREVLRVAAVCGREFPRRVLERVIDDSRSLDDRLRTLRAAELIYNARVWPEAVHAFKHALTQEVAYDAQSDRERRDLHARIAAAMEEVYADRLPEHAGVLAHHYLRAERWDKAFEYLQNAAEQAERSFAVGESLALYDDAVRAAERAGGGVADPATLINIYEARARLYFVTSDFERSAAEGERILPLARLTGNRGKEAEALATIAWASLWGRQFDAAIRYSRDAIAVAEPAGALAVQGRAYYTVGFARAVIGEQADSQVALDKALTFSRAAGDRVYQSLALSAAGLLRNWTGDYAEAARLQEEGRMVAEERGLLLPLLFSCFLRGLTLTGKGDYDEALSAFTQGLTLAERVGDEAIHHRLLNCLGWLYADLGDLDQAEVLNARSARIGRRRGDPGTQPNAELNLAEIFHARGELERAQDQYDAVYRYWKNPPSQWMRFRYSIRMFAGMGALALARGDRSAASSHAAECLALTTRTGSRKNLVKALRLAGDIAHSERDREAAEGYFRQSRDVAAALGNPVQHWKAELALARFLHDTGRDADARVALGNAHAIMEHVRHTLRDERLQHAFARNADVLPLEKSLAGD
jgi:transcriptional regulator with AAA-type ATPase domain/tetratricopeptide (TPR) repeat protein